MHPIAGKCKHCKAELTGYHATRPAASTPLPSLHKPTAAAPSPTPSAGNGHRHTNGHAAHAPIAAAIATAQEVQPVLPPRPTTRSQTAEPTASAWRSWPVLVIVLAMIAIVVAVVLMVWPAAAARAGDSGKRLQPPPAPERMPTTVPDVKPTVPDRRSQGTAPHAAVPDPWAPGAVIPSPAPDPSAKPDADDVDDDDLSIKDPFADPRLGRGLKLNRPGTLFATMVVHLCRKMVECGLDDPMVTGQCDRFSRVIPAPLPSCPAATRCFQHIDALACGKQPTSLAHVGTLLHQFSDCSDAIRC